MNYVKLFENFDNQEHLDDYEDIKRIGNNYVLILWNDEEDNTLCVSITTEDNLSKLEKGSGDPMIAFAAEDSTDKNSVEITDHGFIPGQYLSPEELKTLENIGIKPGQRYKNMQDFWSEIKDVKMNEKNLSKRNRQDLEKAAQNNISDELENSKLFNELRGVIKKYKSKLTPEEIHDVLDTLVNIQKNKF